MDNTLASIELSAQDVVNWNERGYHLHGKLFTDAEVDAIIAACDEVINGVYETGRPPDDIYWRPGDDPRNIRKIDNAWKANRIIQGAVTNERLGHVAAQLIGAPSMRLWQDQISFKPGAGGKVVTWHQDWAYWQMIAECRTVTCWVALDDVQPDAGPMLYLAGSHKLGLYRRPSDISGDDTQRPKLPEGVQLREVPVIIPKGHVAFHHGLMLHASEVNRSGQPRRALVSHQMSGECTYRELDVHVNERAMRQYAEYPQAGERFHGPQFPQIWPSRPA